MGVVRHEEEGPATGGTSRTWWLAGCGAVLLTGLGGAQQALAQTPPRAAAPAAAATPAGPAVLESVLLLGSTGLPPSQLQAEVAPFVGQVADAALLEKIRLTVARAHDAAGLGLVSVDKPVLLGGTAMVRVQVLTLRGVQVLGAPAGDPDAPAVPVPALQAAAEAALPALRPGTTPRLNDADRQLRLANLQPHRRWALDFRAPDETAATAPARPGPQATPFTSQPGATLATEGRAPEAVARIMLPGFSAARQAASQVDARLTVSDTDSFYGRAMVDNAGQKATGRERLRVQLGYGDLFGPGRALDLTAMVSIPSPERQRQLAVRYQHPVPAWSTLFAVDASVSKSRPGVVSGFFDVSGDSRAVNVSARRLLDRRGGLEPYVEVALESAVNDDVVNFFGVNLGSRVGTAPLALTLGGTWQGGPWTAFGQARLRHNTGWGPASGSADYAAARAGARPDWTSLDLAAEVRRAMGQGQEAAVRVQAQVSGDALVSPQQFRAGGQSLVRGLLEGEMAGDSGAALGFEYWWPLGASHRVGVLLDTAQTWRNQALASEPDRSSATSLGLAWRWDLRPGLRLSTSAAQVVQAHQLPTSKRGDARLHLLLDWAF